MSVFRKGDRVFWSRRAPYWDVVEAHVTQLPDSSDPNFNIVLATGAHYQPPGTELAATESAAELILARLCRAGATAAEAEAARLRAQADGLEGEA